MKEAACKTDLGPLTRKLLEQQQEIERLRAELQNVYDLIKTLTAERDEARRLCCERAAMDESGYVKHGDMLHFAESRGWDLFKEDGK